MCEGVAFKGRDDPLYHTPFRQVIDIIEESNLTASRVRNVIEQSNLDAKRLDSIILNLTGIRNASGAGDRIRDLLELDAALESLGADFDNISR